ncbi:MAG TPA: biopolymer transporter ExbD, partial [Isosphaeraceae bacterium]|nr:biopolymer transporter ExbD [Isosphaeraceae bacterium]
MRGLAAAMLFRRDTDVELNDHIDMTPMVDVVFQLMTFMLFSVQMTGGEKVDVPPARHGVGVEESVATFLTLSKPAIPGGEPRLLLGNGEGAVATLDQARQAVADGFKQG